jgi:hypothetical protein
MSNEITHKLSDIDWSTLENRRRLGRATVVSAELVPLLRDPAASTTDGRPAPSDDRLSHDGDPITGLGIAIAVAVPLWILIVLGILIFAHR